MRSQSNIQHVLFLSILLGCLSLAQESQAASAASATSQIEAIAANSSCASYNWKNRGHAPLGYTKGMALTFARSLCRLARTDAGRAPASRMSMASTGDDSTDALTHYAQIFAANKISISAAGSSALRAIYALGMGEGMQESSGNYCEGYDTSAGPETASEAEAGLFQTSYNSMGAAPELSALYQEYQANPQRCGLAVFQEGASCRAQGIVGTGAGATFQAFSKSCPAFAAEYAMIVMRVLRKHYGPINRLQAQVVPACNAMFTQVQALVSQDVVGACNEIQ